MSELKFTNANGTTNRPPKAIVEIDEESIRSGFADSAKSIDKTADEEIEVTFPDQAQG